MPVKACIIVVNKWDLLAKNEKAVEKIREKIRINLIFYTMRLILFLSATTGHHLPKLMPLINEVMENYNFRVSTNKLNQVIGEAIALHHPPSNKGRLFKNILCHANKSETTHLSFYHQRSGWISFFVPALSGA